ncbi:membrane-anchored ubiquitin-fold protein 2 [Actinidia rufa]|uniref:Membrane-anchored ubiquitin-fold protein 2 n=1 Tax=Actinidia rufa TaxID=165716 RepID=A0A7J0H903_9ERIC|nr:membrane-anchored ubiquitin-fold protein 2 [Actinidia rufa]
MNGPRTVKDVKLISAGKILENNRTVGDCKSPLCDIPGGVTTMHVIVQPQPLEKGKEYRVGIYTQITELPINVGRWFIYRVSEQVHCVYIAVAFTSIWHVLLIVYDTSLHLHLRS